MGRGEMGVDSSQNMYTPQACGGRRLVEAHALDCVRLNWRRKRMQLHSKEAKLRKMFALRRSFLPAAPLPHPAASTFNEQTEGISHLVDREVHEAAYFNHPA